MDAGMIGGIKWLVLLHTLIVTEKMRRRFIVVASVKDLK
jgi:hypothetical protein